MNVLHTDRLHALKEEHRRKSAAGDLVEIFRSFIPLTPIDSNRSANS
jgi:hypothetical protein